MIQKKKGEVIKLKVRKPKDVGGEVSIRDSKDGWIDVCKDSDYIFYLFDAYNYFQDAFFQNRMKSDFEWLSENAQAFSPGFRIIVFANKIDKIMENENRTQWIQNEVPKINDIIKNALGPYENHFLPVIPCCLLSNRARINSISLALKYVSEMA